LPGLRLETMRSAGVPSLRDFLRRVPRGEYLFLKDDLGDPEVLDRWGKGRGAEVVVAFAETEVAGLLAVVPGLGWSHHVGEFRLVVDPAHRGRGVGAALARHGMRAAVDAGLAKVTVEVLADQEGVAALFRGLGFVGEALLTDQVRDDAGQLHDILVLAHPVQATWATLATLGVIEAGDPA
jgi:ribosomal protein S18 acetylase RimI-like enzyme